MTKVAVLPGVYRETLSTGKGLMIVRFTFDAGVKIPLHRHAHEQSSYIVKGMLRYVIEGREMILGPGDSCIIPPNAPHEAEALEETLDINSFTPVREDYL